MRTLKKIWNCIMDLNNDNNYLNTAVVLKCPREGEYIVEYKGDSKTYDDFNKANTYMQKLVTPPQGDPK